MLLLQMWQASAIQPPAYSTPHPHRTSQEVLTRHHSSQPQATKDLNSQPIQHSSS